MFRDLQELHLAGYPIAYDRKSLRYKLKDDRPRVPLNLTSSDAFLLSFIAKLLRDHPIFFDREGAELLANKLDHLVPYSMRDYSERLIKHLSVVLPEYQVNHGATPAISSILFAIAGSNKIVDRNQLVLHPYRLVYHGDVWQVLAYSESHDEVRLLCIDSLTPAKILQDQFTFRCNFNNQLMFG